MSHFCHEAPKSGDMAAPAAIGRATGPSLRGAQNLRLTYRRANARLHYRGAR
jgi:hypothetical protein